MSCRLSMEEQTISDSVSVALGVSCRFLVVLVDQMVKSCSVSHQLPHSLPSVLNLQIPVTEQHSLTRRHVLLR